jgi:hypothetical protein
MGRTRNVEEGGSLATAAAPEGDRARRVLREILLQLLLVVVTLAAIEVLPRVIDLR